MDSADLRERLHSTSVPSFRTWAFVLTGFLALVWFLIRVIPKPSRAAYPCQRAAFPIASGFVLWVVGLVTSLSLFRHTRQKLQQARYVVAGVSFAAALVVLAASYAGTPAAPAWALTLAEPAFVPSEGSGQPMGVGRGIHPGRVAWVHDRDATDWDGSGYWWEERHTDGAAVDRMVTRALQTLTGEASDAGAWEALFRHLNSRRGKGEVGYRPGEQIAIKLNLNQVENEGENAVMRNCAMPGPQMVIALLRQLVHVAGVPITDIVLYDATRYAPDLLVDPVRSAFPGVRFVEWLGTGEARETYSRDEATQVHWAEELNLERGTNNPTHLPTVVTRADYLINLANLRAHSLAGITLLAKNHFGSICTDIDGEPTQWAPWGAGIHPYVDVRSRDMGTYNALVDLMGHRDLGEKTLLFIIDGLYAVRVQGERLKDGLQWEMAPFEGDWPSSLFMSQDGVAIESVGLDFLRSEPTMTGVTGDVDNHLHEAALAHDPPSGAFYDPEGDGTRLTSLGVHEHWNDPVDKQYSGNLGGNGIELVTPQMVTAVTGETADSIPAAHSLRNYPNPFNAQTVLSFAVPHEGRAQLSVYNALGQRVGVLLDRHLTAGVHELSWDGRDGEGRDVASGVYVVRLVAGRNALSRKILLAR